MVEMPRGGLFAELWDDGFYLELDLESDPREIGDSTIGYSESLIVLLCRCTLK